ncbi:hypothetical protein [Streptomyces sp. NPDC001250]|uniref:oxidoreductase n=1 Tax=Streptomyces sp. NPDC001250 TaxID=3154382 RepID=UPI0033228C76
MLEHVFRPGALGVLRLANRIVMGAMHLYLETHEDGGAAMAAFYAERARGGAGLVVTGGCAVSSKGSGGRLYARIDDPGRYHAMAAWAAAVHREGGRIALQRDRRPIYPIVGASPEEDTDDHLDDTGAGDGGTVPQVTVTQDRLGKTAGGRRPHTVPVWWQRAEDRRS